MRIGVSTFGCDYGQSGISRYAIELLRSISKIDTTNEYVLFGTPRAKEVFLPQAGNFRSLSVEDRWDSAVASGTVEPLRTPTHCDERVDGRRLPSRGKPPGRRRERGGRRGRGPVVVGTVPDLSSLHARGKYPPDRIAVIHHGVDLATYNVQVADESAQSVRKAYGLDRPFILYVARIEHPGKNHVRLIEAFDQFKTRTAAEHLLVFAGRDWDRADVVHDAAAAARHGKDVRFLSFVPNDHLPGLYGGAALFVFPSFYEGFGLPILEAMACGTAVCCSSVSSLTEVAGDAADYFSPDDPEEIASVIARATSDANHAADLRTRGLRRSGTFSWEATARQTHAVITAQGDAP